jgi:hypothetical protein
MTLASVARHSTGTAEILPPGAVVVEKVLQQHMSVGGNRKPKKRAKRAKKR